MALLQANYLIFSVHMPQDSLCRLCRYHFRNLFSSPTNLIAGVQALSWFWRVRSFVVRCWSEMLSSYEWEGSVPARSWGRVESPSEVFNFLCASGIRSFPCLYSAFQALFLVRRRMLTPSIQNLFSRIPPLMFIAVIATPKFYKLIMLVCMLIPFLHFVRHALRMRIKHTF